MNRRYKIARAILIFWTLFIGIGAVGGALCMLIDPSGKFMGMDAMLPYFQKLPFAEQIFQDFVFSGIALLIVNGITNLTAAAFLFAKRKAGIILGTIFGLTLMLWICIQFYMFPFNFMSTIYFIFGFLQFVTGYICFVGYKQSEFTFDGADYKNIGKDKSQIVIYFSRTGYTRKAAYEYADKLGAELLEITTTEKISGNLGFWWCGRFGMHKWGMPINKVETDFNKYKTVTVFSPVWVFGISAPVRQFLLENAEKLNEFNLVITHFMASDLNRVKKQADELTNNKCKEFRSYKCRFGKITRKNGTEK